MRISDWSSDVCSSDLTIEEASPMGFAAEFHTQLIDVFSRQGLVPTYPQKRVQTLIDHVHPSGSLLLLRARAPTGESIATGIFAGFGRYSTFWGNGSIQSMQIGRTACRERVGQ